MILNARDQLELNDLLCTNHNFKIFKSIDSFVNLLM